MADAGGGRAKIAFKKDRGKYSAGPPVSPAYPQIPISGDLAAGHQFAFMGESLQSRRERAGDESLVGSASQPPSDIYRKDGTGSVNGQMRWRGIERLVVCALGFEFPNGQTGSPRGLGTPEAAKTVSGATNATPIVITTSTAHGYATGDMVRIASVGGNTAANGDWTITVTDTTHFSLQESAGSGAYTSGGTSQRVFAAKHIIEMDTDLSDTPWVAGDDRTAGFNAGDRKVRRGQLGVCKDLDDWVFESAYINKLVITGSPQEGVRFAAELLIYDRMRGSYNSVNWTLPVGPTTRILWSQCQIRLGAQAGGEAGLVDPLCGKFELTIDNKMTGEDQDSGSGLFIIPPTRSEVSEVTLKLDRPRYTDRGLGDSAWMSLFDADVDLAAKIVMLNGPAVGATVVPHQWGFFMPLLRVVESFEPNVEGPGPMKPSWTFRAFSRDPAVADIFAATNYGGVTLKKTSPLVCMMVNGDLFNYLLET